MRWVCFTLLALSASTVPISLAKDEDNNEIAPPRPPINLDSNLRRALLKALTELENEENDKINKQADYSSSSSFSSSFSLPHLDTSDKIVEKASASALSFYASTGPPPDGTSSTTESATLRPIVVIQRSNGVQHKPITTLESAGHKIDAFNDAEQILTSASSSFTSSSAFRKSVAQTPSRNLLTPEIKTTKIADKVETTTAITTTTSTEENQAKVEDVQFFSAPLVAAFTVHQDERGLPKSVEPIYRQIQKIENSRVKNNAVTSSTTSTTEASLSKFTPLIAHQEQLRQQLALQQKQKALEDEIFRLKQQQQQQNYLIRQQQFLNEQHLQIQRQKLLDEQIRIRHNQEGFTPIRSPSLADSFENDANRIRNDFNANHSRIKGSLVSFQPSVSLNPNEQAGILPLNAQQLPIKNAVDFRSNLNGGFNRDFFGPQISFTTPQPQPQSQNLLVGSPSNFNFAQQVNLEPAQTLTAPRHNRVFRQESDTGNFFSNGNANNGFNGNYFQQFPQQNRFFRSNNFETFSSPYNNFNRLQPPVVNHHLNNLLYNSGVITKQHDDLNIISKVLSLNHLGGEHHNQRYAASSVSEQRVPYMKNV